MSNVHLNHYPGNKKVNLLNGSAAAHDLVGKKAMGSYAKRFSIASQIFGIANAPTLQPRDAWGLTTNVRRSTIKLRADLPAVLEEFALHGQLKCFINADVVLYNPTAEACIVTGIYLYQGDSTKAESMWLAATGADIAVGIGMTTVVKLYGSCHPGYLHAIPRTDNDMGMLFIDSGAQKTGTAPKVLFCSVEASAYNGVSDLSSVYQETPATNSDITQFALQPYLDALYACNDQLHCQSSGTMAPIDQYTGNGAYGFELNAYRTTRVYHLFMPNTTYDSTTEQRGSFWLPLGGMGVKGTDGRYRYRVQLTWMQRCSASVTLSYTGRIFKAGLTTSTDAGTIASQAVTANTNYIVTREIVIESATNYSSGLALAMRVQRSGTDSSDVYIYTSQFSAKVVPY